MKKIFSNIRTMAALLMAGAAFAACSSSDDIIENQQPANNGKQAYTLTINASKGGSTTRALTDNNGAIEASWETTDEIHVTQADGTEIGTLRPTNISGLTATFTGTISGDADIDVDDVLTLTYHPIEELANQDGTLSGSENSAENYDMAVATLTISEINGKNIIVSESSANFVNQTAVVVLSPHASYQSEGETTNISSLIVSVTMNNVPEAGTVTEHLGPFTLSSGQPYYFSLPSQSLLAEVLAAKYSLSASAVSTLLASATITFTGQQEGVYYLTCSKTGYKFAAGKYYKLNENNFVMTEVIKTSAADKDVYYENQDGSWSNTVTFAVNREIGWKIVGDDVYCGDKQLYFNSENSMMFASGFVKATDDFIPSWGGTYSLVTPAAPAETADVTWNFSEMTGENPNLNEGYTNGVTLQGMGNLDFGMGSLNAMGSGLTFTAPSGKKFTKIVITATNMPNINDWTNGGDPINNFTSTWTGDASSVSFTGTANGVTSIVFTLEETDDVTWKFSEMTEENPNLNEGYTNGVTLQGMGNLDFGMGSLNTMGSGLTFTAPSGKKFTKIVINATGMANIDDWTNGGEPGNWTSTWTGDASSSVSFSGSANGITSIVFTIEASAAPAVWDGDLSKLTAESTAEFATATDGMTITGALAEGVNVKVSIAEGATVTLDGVTINGVSDGSYKWAGINCLGDATIILSGTNTVKGFFQKYPGIHVPENKTLTIQGSGSLTASSNGTGCGIGGGWQIACGNIVIAGGNITANGGDGAAGIGGSGDASCGTVTITNGVTSVTATKGDSAPYSIGAGIEGSCGTVTIGCTLDGGGNPVGGTTGQISTSPYTYQPSN